MGFLTVRHARAAKSTVAAAAQLRVEIKVASWTGLQRPTKLTHLPAHKKDLPNSLVCSSQPSKVTPRAPRASSHTSNAIPATTPKAPHPAARTPAKAPARRKRASEASTPVADGRIAKRPTASYSRVQQSPYQRIPVKLGTLVAFVPRTNIIVDLGQLQVVPTQSSDGKDDIPGLVEDKWAMLRELDDGLEGLGVDVNDCDQLDPDADMRHGMGVLSG